MENKNGFSLAFIVMGEESEVNVQANNKRQQQGKKVNE